MADRTIQLNREYVVAGASVTVAGTPYTVANDLTISVPDTVNQGDIDALGVLVVSNPTATTQPEMFARRKTNIDATNTTDKQGIFTVPPGKKAVVTAIYPSNASAVLTGLSMKFGFSAEADDVTDTAGASQGDDQLSTTAFYSEVPLLALTNVGTRGAAGTVFGVKIVNPMGAPTTFDVDVLGYFV